MKTILRWSIAVGLLIMSHAAYHDMYGDWRAMLACASISLALPAWLISATEREVRDADER